MRALSVFPWPLTDLQVHTLRRAKEPLGIDYPIQLGPAVPGSPGRVLTLTERPPWICDVADSSRFGDLPSALRWCLEGGPGGYLVLDYLTDILGPGVREVVDA